ncbi:aspartyl protease family protein [Mucilaginibacter arboris]|uniref:Peptide-binding protein n=1 Tax=Mucilaginibacter arboris TaxID=2682090 RepID=A0A7K1SYR9_9SPHI|nr:aspartyl protease family protein [Mucilaginibacter arboris]MVN22453.1 peptide-binding protein [Mucilaginibacter arboris]
MLTAIAMPVCGQTFTISNGQHKALVPFRFIRNMLVVQVQINNRGPYNFILDTGCGLMLITDPLLVDSLSLKYKKRVKVTGLGEGEDLDAWMVPVLDVKIKGIEGKNISAAILSKDVLDLSSFAGIHIHGLIGYDFFNSFPVKINFTDSTLTAFSTHKVPVWRKGTKIPLNIEDKKPYLNANINFKEGCGLPLKLMVDLGAGHPLSVENGWNSSSTMPDKFITAANLGVGLSGPINGFMSRVDEMKIGNYQFRQVITAFPDSCSAMDKVTTIKRDGSIGIDLLKRFVLLFDYQQGYLYLKPSYNLKEPFEHDMSGLEYFAAGNDFHRIIVCRVEPGSAADQLGIEKDDELLSINFKEVSRMSLQEIDEILRSKNDRTLLLEVMHQNIPARLLLTLKRRI